MKKAIFGALVLALIFGGLWFLQKRGLQPSSRLEVVPEPGRIETKVERASPVASSVPSLAKNSPQTQQLVAELNQILDSRNDNDPRLDHDFNRLSAEAKAALQQRYREIAPEKRNERGTVVYLLGRNLETPEDVVFFKEVLSESPCLSMADCGREGRKDEEGHREIGIEVSLAYPQLVALKQIERRLAAGESSAAFRAEALRAIQAGKSSRAAIVARDAGQLEQRLGN